MKPQTRLLSAFLFFALGSVDLALGQQINVLPFRPIDAEFSRHANELVFVATNPSRAYITDKSGTAIRSEIDLELPPVALSLSLDGSRAVVGHSGAISYIDVVSGSLLATIAVTAEVQDLVMAGNFAYVTGSRSSGVIDLVQRTELTGERGISGLNPEVHPSGYWIHSSRGGSPDDIVKFDVSQGPVSNSYDSPYHGDFTVCQNLWHARDGKRIYTACGDVYSSSDVREKDLLYTGTVPVDGRIVDLTETTSGELIAVIMREGLYGNSPVEGRVRLFTIPFYNDAGAMDLPAFVGGGRSVQAHATRLFSGPGERELIVLAQADQSSGFLNDYGVVILQAESPPIDVSGDVRQPLYAGFAATVTGEGLADVVANAPGAEPVARLGGVSVRLAAESGPVLECPAYYVSPRAISFRVPAEAPPGQAVLTVVQGSNQFSTEARVFAADGRRAAALSHSPVDAEYSQTLDAVVTVASEPNRLTLFDLKRQAEIGVVPLSLTPTSVSVAPDGLSAAVGHAGWISIVDLAGLRVAQELAIAADVGDVILGGGRWAYAIPSRDQWEKFHSVNLDTGEAVELGTIRAGSVGRLHPGGRAIYLADRGVSPSDIEKVDLSEGPGRPVYDSPYHGDFAMCGNVWFSADGQRIITPCGNTFRASDVRAQDMTFSGKMEHAQSLSWATHLLSSNLIGVINGRGPFRSTVSELQFYDHQFLGFRGRAGLPVMPFGFEEGRPTGRFLFARPDSADFALLGNWLPSGSSSPDHVVTLVSFDAAVVSAAGYQNVRGVAPGSLAGFFGSKLASRSEAASSLPLPDQLAGAQLILTDSEGTEFNPMLLYGSPGQFNLLVPDDAALGLATVGILRPDGGLSLAAVEIGPVAPGLFSADATGAGVAAALAYRVHSDATTSTDPIFFRDETGAPHAVGVSLAGDDQVYLLLFGSGIRNWEISVSARVGGQDVPVVGAVAQGQFAGLDQVNIGPLPKSLAGRGAAAIEVTVDGRTANIVMVRIL